MVIYLVFYRDDHSNEEICSNEMGFMGTADPSIAAHRTLESDDVRPKLEQNQEKKKERSFGTKGAPQDDRGDELRRRWHTEMHNVSGESGRASLV
jgi:hypothetical protein